jgi:hypothetical protein
MQPRARSRFRRSFPPQERVTCKKRFNLLPTQKPAVPM